MVYGLTVDGCGQQDIMVRAEDLEDARAALASGPEMDDGEPDAAGPDTRADRELRTRPRG